MDFNENILPSETEKRFINLHLNDDVRRLALSIGGDMTSARQKYVLQQIAGWQAMSRKVPCWTQVDGLVYPVHLSVEQCSSQATAYYKAEQLRRLCGKLKSYVDITGGFGVDFAFMSDGFEKATYVEQNEELSAIVSHNLPLLGRANAITVNADGVEYLQDSAERYTAIYLDPARRDKNGGKTVHLSDCTPNIVELEELLLSKADVVVAKLSPMLDISEALSQLRHVTELHVVSVDNECKELIVVMQASADGKVMTTCVNISPTQSQLFRYERSDESVAVCSMADSVRKYLYEPNASIMKAGAFRSVSSVFDIDKLHASSHLYTSDMLLGDFPGRVFEVLSIGSTGKNGLPPTMQGLAKANIAVRNYPIKPDDIRKKLKLKDGGDDFIFGTTLMPDKKVLIHCRKACVPTR